MRRISIITLVVICFAMPLKAQYNMTLYQMHDIPQSNTLNPAVPISCGWIVGMPALGSISLGAGAPLSYNELGAGQDTLPVSSLISKLHNTNVLSTRGSLNLIMVGYRSEQMFYQFTVNEQYSALTAMSKDPLVMLMEGNAGYVGKTIKGAPTANALYYREYAFNVSRQLDPTLWVGARAKLLFGRLSLKSVNNTADFYTDPGTYDLQLTSDLLAHASIPGTVTLDPVTNKVDDFTTDIKASDFIFNPTNIGGAIDLGLTKVFENDLEVSASLLNLGFIKWSKNTHSFSQQGSLTFTGPFAPINEYDALRDTLKSFLELDYSQGKFTQMLTPTLLAGANYPLNSYLRAGLTGMVEWQYGVVPWALTATAFTEGLPVFDIGASYTITNQSYVNLGVGLAVHLGAADIHFTTDNIIGLFKPFDARYATAQFGINFRFGCGGGGDDSPKRSSSLKHGLACPSFN